MLVASLVAWRTFSATINSPMETLHYLIKCAKGRVILSLTRDSAREFPGSRENFQYLFLGFTFLEFFPFFWFPGKIPVNSIPGNPGNYLGSGRILIPQTQQSQIFQNFSSAFYFPVKFPRIHRKSLRIIWHFNEFWFPKSRNSNFLEYLLPRFNSRENS